ncbi:MAG: FAD binding domain-containing protein [Planctomycetaceae bacterium]|jgi:xanthine dehydrogenase YagS FAD-binding subunit
MSSFEFASPHTEAEAVELLREPVGATTVLAGGTDLVSLLKSGVVNPRRVVDITRIESLKGVTAVTGGLMIGALTSLEELRIHPLLAAFPAVAQAADGVHAIQVLAQGTLGGDLCHLPNCWYFRNGYGLLAQDRGESLPAEGRSDYHAILGNQGPAKFVSASRLAPALIALNAKVRIVGPHADEVALLPLEYFFVSPKTEEQGICVLRPGQLVTHVFLPEPAGQLLSATYDVLQLEGLDYPLASAGVALEMDGPRVSAARVVMGHVAPTPWLSLDAAAALVGRSIDEASAQAAGDAAVAQATPLADNEYKVQIARAAVKRAVLRAAGLLQGVS